MTSPSAYVARCQLALKEYERLRFLGIDHDVAVVQSGFREAIQNKPSRDEQLAQLRDVRKLIAGDGE